MNDERQPARISTPDWRTPEERELEKKLADLASLETDLVHRELDLATLHGSLRTFETLYLRLVGALYAELDEVEARIAERLLRQNGADEQLHRQAQQARVKAQESASATGVVQSSAHGGGFQPGERLKRLYREIARRIHPDLATDPNERARRNRVMADANQAYETDDEAALLKILDEWQSSPELVEGEGTPAELVRTIRKLHQIERRLSEIAAEVADLKQSELFVLFERVKAAQTENRDLLTEMADELKRQIHKAKTRFDQPNIGASV
jgi:hypothetical protein